MLTVAECELRAFAKARRELSNLRSFVRRKDLLGVMRRDATVPYGRAFEAVVRLEDLVGVDAAAVLSDRLTALRWEAMRLHLLDPSELAKAEADALARVR